MEQLDPRLRRMLSEAGIPRLYRHQQEAILHILNHEHTLVATPTASGKSLIYHLPVLQSLLSDRSATALYLFPLKALAQDQLRGLEKLAGPLTKDFDPMQRRLAAIFDGDTTSYHRRKIRDHPPGIIITNPDMLHLSLLPHHDAWSGLFANLTHVIIDEIHTYRGVFGSHVSWVLRRLRRLCRLYGSDPVFVLSSATIGNPLELGELLTGTRMRLVERSGAPRSARNVLLINPLEAAATAATLLLEAAVHRSLRTIVYTQSRKMTELITIWTGNRLGALSAKVASYRAGFLPEDRRRIEQELTHGSLLGVISTSALELGIDIGNLDICILVGFPGSMMATWQRAGRVGRAGRESLVVLIGHEDAMDQHFMRNPDDFFNRPVEPVTLDPDNRFIAADHLTCAAAELPLTAGEAFTSGKHRQILDALTSRSELLLSADGTTWFASRKYPQRRVDLRGGGRHYQILRRADHSLLGRIDGHRALSECHPGAIYLHMAKTWHIDSLDLETREILASPCQPDYFTRANVIKHTEIIELFATRQLGSTRVSLGRLRVSEQVTGYQKIQARSMRTMARFPLELPVQHFETVGFWIEIPESIRRAVEQRRLHFMGGIHALEHAIIGIMPLHVLCDRNDIGGISQPWHEQLAGSAVFVYDGCQGGIGLSAKAYNQLAKLFEQTTETVLYCPCDLGCPSCVHSPKCGSGNRPIDKAACRFLLEQLLIVPAKQSPPPLPRVIASSQAASGHQATTTLPSRFAVFDLETRRSAQEVGGWHRADLMRISVAVLWDSSEQRCFSYTEDEVDALVARLFAMDLVVGFNNKRFDNKVLSAYTAKPLARLPSLDLLEEISRQLGYRLSLDRLAEKTLGVTKSASGLDALRWFKQGRMQELTDYCRRDVEITRDLFIFGFQQRYLLFQNKAGREVRLPVDFAAAIERIMATTPSNQGQTRLL